MGKIHILGTQMIPLGILYYKYNNLKILLIFHHLSLCVNIFFKENFCFISEYSYFQNKKINNSFKYNGYSL